MKMTIRLLLGFALTVVLARPASAQLGLTFRYQFPDAQNWALLTQPGDLNRTKLLGNGYSFGIDYWFRLKNTRIEFMPELNFSGFQPIEANGSRTRAHWMGFYFNTNFYLFDFKGDCDCPTFSKEGSAAQKGFFVQVSPGISLLSQRIELPEGGKTLRHNAAAFSVGVGLGFDIGFSDLLTLTPMGSLRYFPTATWDELSRGAVSEPDEFSVPDENTSILLWQVGLRLGFRFGQTD